MLKEIKRGDTVRCISCGDPIVIGSATLWSDQRGEYVICPHCQITYDLQAYHLIGDLWKEED